MPAPRRRVPSCAHESCFAFVALSFLVTAACSSGGTGASPTGAGSTSSALSISSRVSRGPARPARRDRETRTPIKHVVVIVGENRTFDHVFATYKPRHDQRVWNLLSQAASSARTARPARTSARSQKSAVDKAPNGFLIEPGVEGAVQGASAGARGRPDDAVHRRPSRRPRSAENGLPADYYQLPDDRRHRPHVAATSTRASPNATTLPPGPVPAHARRIPYDAYTASPVHRFYQMWQQLDCSARMHHAREPVGLPGRSVPLGRDDDRRRQQRQAAAAGFNDRRPAKARPRWASTTSRRATCHTSSSSPTTTR